MLEARVAAPGVLTLSEPLTAGRHIQFLFERPLRSPFDLEKASASLVLLEHVPKGHENHIWESAYTIDLPSDRMGADGKSLRACWRVHLPERDAPPRASAPSKYRWVLTVELHGKRTWDLKCTFEIPFSHAPVRASVTAGDPLAGNPYQPGQARRATDSRN